MLINEIQDSFNGFLQQCSVPLREGLKELDEQKEFNEALKMHYESLRLQLKFVDRKREWSLIE